MSRFLCPNCKQPLSENASGLVCPSGHAFDRAKHGYVNLLLSRGGGNHGDDRLMVRARRDFLDGGYYHTLADALAETAAEYARPGVRVFDAGCGEGYYTAHVKATLEAAGLSPVVFGVDISRDALTAAGKRDREIQLAVASVYELPVADAGCDMLLSVFSPLCLAEFGRVLTRDGTFIMAYPLEDHLWELKKSVYDEPYRNKVDSDEQEGFTLLSRRELHYEITLEGHAAIENLFMMTPYYYKTARKDQEKLAALESLKTQVAFAVCAYRK
ncbi:MAG: methyltransferase domain-containing protein [Clostridiaceae bacterium]|nr:methyltransferase domain-containing protein [Clostridiaceae bacterium]